MRPTAPAVCSADRSAAVIIIYDKFHFVNGLATFFLKYIDNGVKHPYNIYIISAGGFYYAHKSER